MNARISRIGRTLVVLVAIVAAAPVLAQTVPEERNSSEHRPRADVRTYVPDTVSPGWREVFGTYPDPTRTPRMPGPDDLEGWKKVYDAKERQALEAAEEAAKKLQVNVADKTLGGVPILEITPESWVDNGKLLVYTHGGAYTMFSARSTLTSAALVADRTGLRVISVD